MTPPDAEPNEAAPSLQSRLSNVNLEALPAQPSPSKPDPEYLKELRDFQRASHADYEAANKLLEEKSRANTTGVTGALALAALVVKPDALVIHGLDSPRLEQLVALVAIGVAALLIVYIFAQNAAVQRPTDAKLVSHNFIYSDLPANAPDRATLLRTQQLVYRDYGEEAASANLKKGGTVKRQFRLVLAVFVLILVYFGSSLYYQAATRTQAVTPPTPANTTGSP